MPVSFQVYNSDVLSLRFDKLVGLDLSCIGLCTSRFISFQSLGRWSLFSNSKRTPTRMCLLRSQNSRTGGSNVNSRLLCTRWYTLEVLRPVESFQGLLPSTASAMNFLVQALKGMDSLMCIAGVRDLSTLLV